jgi:ABC-2 type transport system ATP-binding protein
MLRIARAGKRFGDVQALDDCTFSISRGHMLGFLGPNGAGKTTAMRAIFGLVELDAGEVVWDEHPVGFSERLKFGYMPEERGLYPRMPVGEQIAYFGRLHGLSVTAARDATRAWLEQLGLADRATAKVEELSHGNQQRAQLAAALVHEPDLLVLDEPFAGLDPVAVQTLAAVLRAEAGRGAAVLFSSH